MKKIFWAFGVSFIVISILLLVIVKRGVIIRPQPLIKPTVIQENFEPVSRHLALRMFPEFQSTDYVIWNLDPENTESQLLEKQILQEYQKIFQKNVNVLSAGQPIETCPKPCWIFSKVDEEKLNNFVKVDWVNFDRVEPIPESCMNKKILDADCIKFVSLNSIERKLKEPESRYFFLHKYMDTSFYLFIQTPRNLIPQ